MWHDENTQSVSTRTEKLFWKIGLYEVDDHETMHKGIVEIVAESA